MKRTTALIAALLFALAGCSGQSLDDIASEIDSATDASVTDEAEQNAVELAGQVEEEMSALSQQIESSDAASDLESAWGDVQAKLTAAIATMQTDGTITADGLEDAFADFETELDQAGEAVAPNVRDAWTSLRAKVEQMMS